MNTIAYIDTAQDGDNLLSQSGEIVDVDSEQNQYIVRFPGGREARFFESEITPVSRTGFARSAQSSIGLDDNVAGRSYFLKAMAALFLVAVIFLVSSQVKQAGLLTPEKIITDGFKRAINQKLPRAQDPKTITYDWDYNSRLYSLSLTLHRSIADFYGREPKGIVVGREEASLKKYLILPDEDNCIDELAARLDELAAEGGLDENQKLELAVAFVQSIPYDTEKAKTDRRHPRYIYEVLYENKGICSDKSFLMYALLRKMGYGAAIFEYLKENHMNVGVQCDMQYSTDNSGYSMIETTNPKFKIGAIPSIDSSSSQAVEQQTFRQYNLRNPNTTTGKQLSSPTVLAETTGKKYSGIAQTVQTSREIADIQDYLIRQKPIIEQKQADISALERQMSGYRAANDVGSYNALVAPHNQLSNEIRTLVDDYNAKVNRYNALNQ